MATELKLRVENVYGNITCYPACEKSALLAKLAGTKTLTNAALETIRALGYEITLVDGAAAALNNRLNKITAAARPMAS